MIGGHPIEHFLSNYNFWDNSIRVLIFGVIQNVGCQDCSNSNSDKIEWLSLNVGIMKRNKKRELNEISAEITRFKEFDPRTRTNALFYKTT